MADHIVISGIEAYDGTYEFDASQLTNRELHTIKRLANIRAGEMSDALEAGDSDMLVALAVICLQRHGKTIDEDLIWDAQAGSITYEGAPVEDDVSPPALTSGDEESFDAAEKNDSSGISGPNGSESSLTAQSDIGRASSARSVTSGQPT